MKNILLPLTVFLSLNAGATSLPGDGPSALLDKSTGNSKITVGAGTSAPQASSSGDCPACRAHMAKLRVSQTLPSSRLSAGAQRRVLPSQAVQPSTTPADGQGQEQSGGANTGK